jgi:ubiquinone/menaquinone biosynthesis C-methylase UbiE
MDARVQRRVQRYGWDKAANCYEMYWARQLKVAQDRLLTLAELRPGQHVLDVACGTGLVTLRAAAQVGPAGRVVGTDISEVMIERLHDAAASAGLTQVVGQRADAEALGLPEETFDVGLCALGLMYIPEPVRALEHIGRALRPGGRVVVAVWGERAKCGWAEVFPIVERRVASDVCPLFFQMGAGETLRHTLTAAGFNQVEVYRIATTLWYDSAEAACGAAFAGGPVALAYARFDEATRAAVHEEYLTSIQVHRRETGYDVPGEFVVARARKS